MGYLNDLLGNQGCQGEIAENPIGVRVEAREIRIFKVLNGYVVFCGCKQVVFENKDKMLSEISRYLDNPEAVEKEYLNLAGKKV